MKGKMRAAGGVIAAAMLVVGATSLVRGQSTAAPNRPSEELKAYLRDHLRLGGNASPDTTTKINVVKVETNRKTEQDIVYVSGQEWCGSGGCTLLILEPSGSTFKVLGRTTIVQLPIMLLPSAHGGHPDIGVTVQGGGVLAGYEAVLSFDGKRYPGNPSTPPARKTNTVRGKVIIANTDDSVPLFD